MYRLRLASAAPEPWIRGKPVDVELCLITERARWTARPKQETIQVTVTAMDRLLSIHEKGIKAKTEPSKPHVDPITGVCKFQLTLTGRDSGGNSSQLLALRYDVKPPTSVLHHPAL
eukprot:gene28264-8428_t